MSAKTKIKLVGTWDEEFHLSLSLPKGTGVFKPQPFYVNNWRTFLQELNAFQKKKKAEFQIAGKTDDWHRELDITVEYHYRKRSLDQNRLMWALYEIEANEQNGGHKRAEGVKAEDLHDADIKMFAPKAVIKLAPGNVNNVYMDYYVEKEELKKDPQGEESVYVHVRIGTSRFDTRQMCEWIDRQFSRISENGVAVTNPGDIQKYWKDFKEFQNDEKIILFDKLLSKDEYKRLTPICEASGAYLGEGGECAHIVAEGMGGHNTSLSRDFRDSSANWLHLSTDIHRDICHGQGWGEFIKLYPHCEFKVLSALKTDKKTLNSKALRTKNESERDDNGSLGGECETSLLRDKKLDNEMGEDKALVKEELELY